MTYKLAMTQPAHYLTVKEAAVRVERSTRQIETWIRGGLPVYLLGRVRYVREDQLLHTLRLKQLANPAHSREPGAEVRRSQRVVKHLAKKYGDTPRKP